LGGSEYLKVVHRLVKGLPPKLDLAREAALQRVLVKGVATGLIRSAHDCAEGGLAVTLAESCFDTGLGAVVDVAAVEGTVAAFADVATLFGESASRVVVSVDSARTAELEGLATESDVPVAVIGRVGGSRIRISIDGREVIDEPLADAERVWAGAIDQYFESRRAIA
jgi:phosphoribosylformylglycinamidine synthase